MPLVQQALTDIESGSLIVPAVPSIPTDSPSPETQLLETQVRFIRRLREGMFKGSVLCGGPYGINALGAVNFALSPELSAAVNAAGPVRGPHNTATPEEYQQRGRELFQTIYQHHSKSSFIVLVIYQAHPGTSSESYLSGETITYNGAESHRE